MPFEKRRDGPKDKPVCVYKKGTNKRFGCHPDDAAADAQIRALYANVNDGRRKEKEDK